MSTSSSRPTPWEVSEFDSKLREFRGKIPFLLSTLRMPSAACYAMMRAQNIEVGGSLTNTMEEEIDKLRGRDELVTGFLFHFTAVKWSLIHDTTEKKIVVLYNSMKLAQQWLSSWFKPSLIYTTSDDLQNIQIVMSAAKSITEMSGKSDDNTRAFKLLDDVLEAAKSWLITKDLPGSVTEEFFGLELQYPESVVEDIPRDTQ